MRSLSLCNLLVILPLFVSCTWSLEDLHCTRPGLFLVPGSCREYYECYRWKNIYIPRPLECMADMYFDEISSSCRTLLPSHSPPRCRSPADNAATGVRTEGISTGGTLHQSGQVPAHRLTESLENQPEAAVDPTHRQVEALENHPETAVDPSDVAREGISNVGAVDQPNSPALVNTSVDTNDGLPVDTNDGLPTCNSTNTTAATTEDYAAAGTVENCTSTGANITDEEATTPASPSPLGVIICDYVNTVSKHTSTLQSPPFRNSLQHQTVYNQLVERYNVILERAKNNTFTWRSGESISGAIMYTYKLASEYEEEFNRKFTIYQTQILKPINTEEIVEKLKREILELREEILTNQEILDSTNSPSVRRFFLKSITAKQQELLSKEEEIDKSSKEARDLEELLYFLPSFKNDAAKIENLGNDTDSRMQELSAAFERDLESLERFSKRVNKSIQSLLTEGEGYQSQLSQNRETETSIDQRKEAYNEELIRLNAANNDNLKEIRKLQRQIDKKQKEYDDKKEVLCRKGGLIEHYLEDNPTAEQLISACNQILAFEQLTLDITYEKTTIQNLMGENESNRLRIMTILDEQKIAREDLLKLVNKAPEIGIKLREAESELGNLQFLSGDLRTLIESAKAATNSLAEIRVEYQEMYLQFDKLVKEVIIMTAEGQAAETDQARQEVKDAIEEKLSALVSKLVVLQETDLATCW